MEYYESATMFLTTKAVGALQFFFCFTLKFRHIKQEFFPLLSANTYIS